MERHEQDFFGRCQPRPGVWDANDGEWGKAMMDHYNSSSKEKDLHTADPSIPRILHFIWLGTGPLPDPTLMDSWRQYHPDWEVRLWRDDDIASLDVYNKDALQYALQYRHYGMASDVVRLELLHTYGGVYVDVDYRCVQSLNELQHWDFYCGASNVGCVEVNNGLMASRPRGAVVQLMREAVHEWFQLHGRPLSIIASFAGTSSLTDMDICRQTGPGMLTRTLGRLFVSQRDALVEEIMIFPFNVFHPMPNTDRHRHISHQDIVQEYAIPGTTRAIHLWHCSWQKTRDTI